MVIMYGSYDIWGKLNEFEQSGLSRSDVDIANITKDEIQDVFGISSEDISKVTYGDTEYYKNVTTTTDSTYGVTVTMTQLLTVHNGYIYSFMFNGTSDNKFYNDFDALINSVKYDNETVRVSEKAGYTDFTDKYSFDNILLSLIITVVIYSLPIIIYRYSIRKGPVEPQKAKKITIIYGVVSFVVMSILIFIINGSGTAGGAILLWSYVNYRMLVGGKKQSVVYEKIHPDAMLSIPNFVGSDMYAADNSATHVGSECELNCDSCEPERLNAPEIRFCRRCGNKLQPNSYFCNKCGNQIDTKNEG